MNKAARHPGEAARHPGERWDPVHVATQFDPECPTNFAIKGYSATTAVAQSPLLVETASCPSYRRNTPSIGVKRRLLVGTTDIFSTKGYSATPAVAEYPLVQSGDRP